MVDCGNRGVDVPSVSPDLGGLKVCKTRRGDFAYFPYDGVVGACLAIYGEWAENEIGFFRQFIRPGSIVIDAGANIGTLTAAFSNHVGPSGKVIAIEASPEVGYVLRHNITSNKFDNVTIIEAALGGAPGEALIAQVPPTAWSNVGGLKVTNTDRTDALKTPVITLESLEASEAAFLKLDLEGMEAEVLASAPSVFKEGRPVVACEVNDLDAGLEIVRVMRDYNYRSYFVSFRSYNPQNFNGAPNRFGEAREASLIFVPVEQVVPCQTPGSYLSTFSTASQLAKLIFETPLYGDVTEHDKIASLLVEDRNRRDERIVELMKDNESLRDRRDERFVELMKDNERLRTRLKEQRDATVRILDSKDLRLRVATKALRAAQRRIDVMIADREVDPAVDDRGQTRAPEDIDLLDRDRRTSIRDVQRQGSMNVEVVNTAFAASGLNELTHGMPEWWAGKGNRIFATPGTLPLFTMHPGLAPPEGATIVLGSGSRPTEIMLWGTGARVYVGPDCHLEGVTIGCGGRSTVFLAGELATTKAADINARNGGLVYVGSGGLWSSDAVIYTDDMHAILSIETGKRINVFGGSVIVGPDVWLGYQTVLLPGADIGGGSIIGARSVVNRAIPPNCVAVGAPARVTRTGVTWSQEDLPPAY